MNELTFEFFESVASVLVQGSLPKVTDSAPAQQELRLKKACNFCD